VICTVCEAGPCWGGGKECCQAVYEGGGLQGLYIVWGLLLMQGAVM
jgi:hypothetical protein